MNTLEAILLPEHVEAGISLREDDHNIYLELDGKQVAVFTWHSTVASIRQAAHQITQEMKSGITYCEARK